MKYANIVFIQRADETEEPEKIYREQGAEALLEYLKQWDFGAESETDITDSEPWGTSDTIYQFDNYILTVNMGLPYFSLAREIR
jgi:hypothetical protein